jgi:hypothetical protein
MPYGKLQALPTAAKPVQQFVLADDALYNIAKEIRRVVEYMLTK